MTERRTRVYVAGPISSSGNVLLNCREGILAGTQLLSLGYAPYVPHLSCFWEIVTPMEYEDWLGMDIIWVEGCDAVLRLPGESKGADREVTFAHSLRIPVFHSIEELTSQIEPKPTSVPTISRPAPNRFVVES